jgi:hypothetical protein
MWDVYGPRLELSCLPASMLISLHRQMTNERDQTEVRPSCIETSMVQDLHPPPPTPDGNLVVRWRRCRALAALEAVALLRSLLALSTHGGYFTVPSLVVKLHCPRYQAPLPSSHSSSAPHHAHACVDRGAQHGPVKRAGSLRRCRCTSYRLVRVLERVGSLLTHRHLLLIVALATPAARR